MYILTGLLAGVVTHVTAIYLYNANDIEGYLASLLGTIFGILAWDVINRRDEK